MALVYQQDINEHTKIAVWLIDEPVSYFSKRVSPLKKISHPLKNIQHLAALNLLLELHADFPFQHLQIATSGKPFLKDSAYFFSIAHAGKYAAVITSKTQQVGIDIESNHNKANLVANKFLSENEQEMIHDFSDELMVNNTMAWTIKEALYKLDGMGGLRFKEQININEFSNQKNIIVSKCEIKSDTILSMEVHSIKVNELFLSWVVN